MIESIKPNIRLVRIEKCVYDHLALVGLCDNESAYLKKVSFSACAFFYKSDNKKVAVPLMFLILN